MPLARPADRSLGQELDRCLRTSEAPEPALRTLLRKLGPEPLGLMVGQPGGQLDLLGGYRDDGGDVLGPAKENHLLTPHGGIDELIEPSLGFSDRDGSHRDNVT